MCSDVTVEYSVCDGWPNGDVGGRKLRRLARSSGDSGDAFGKDVFQQPGIMKLSKFITVYMSEMFNRFKIIIIDTIDN